MQSPETSNTLTWNDDEYVYAQVIAARNEIGDYEQLHRDVASVAGTLELVAMKIAELEDPNVSRRGIQDAIDDARRKLMPIYAATNILAEMDREVE